MLVATIAFAGNIVLDVGTVSGTDAEWLQYDDATDFLPTAYNCDIHQSEFWFYHHSSYPWDTSDVYVEVWDGAVSAPVTQLDQTMITAIHYAPVYANYPTPLNAGPEFWAFANTEMSAGGWPSILGDAEACDHSFFSDDFIIWEPWENGDYFVAVYVDMLQLDNTTWGSIKVTF